MTSRLCRMLKIRKITNVVKNAKNAMYVKFSKDESTDTVRSWMTQYGVVVECASCSQQKTTSTPPDERSIHWWKVEFENEKEAETVFESLSGLGIEVRKDDPYNSNGGDITEITPFIEHQSSSVPSHPYIESHFADVTSRCHSCLGHFMRYPKTLCGVPNVYWYILFVLSLLSLPIFTYALADLLEMDIHQVSYPIRYRTEG